MWVQSGAVQGWGCPGRLNLTAAAAASRPRRWSEPGLECPNLRSAEGARWFRAGCLLRTCTRCDLGPRHELNTTRASPSPASCSKQEARVVGHVLGGAAVPPPACPWALQKPFCLPGASRASPCKFTGGSCPALCGAGARSEAWCWGACLCVMLFIHQSQVVQAPGWKPNPFLAASQPKAGPCWPLLSGEAAPWRLGGERRHLELPQIRAHTELQDG